MPFRQVERIHAPELLAGNQAFHALLTEGVKVTVRRDGLDRGEIVWLADFDCPESNEFLAVNQLTVMENGQQKRPDLVLFVNGLPLAVIELKNPADESATLFSAFQQLQTYNRPSPRSSPSTRFWLSLTGWRRGQAPCPLVSAASWHGRPMRTGQAHSGSVRLKR